MRGLRERERARGGGQKELKIYDCGNTEIIEIYQFRFAINMAIFMDFVIKI